MAEPTWTRVDRPHLGRGLVHGERGKHAALSITEGAYTLSEPGGVTHDLQLDAWCEWKGIAPPDASDIAWLWGHR